MASYHAVHRNYIRPIGFTADRRHWTWERCPEAVGAIHDNLKDLIIDLATASVSNIAESLATYLGISCDPSASSLAQKLFEEDVMIRERSQ